MNGYFKKYFFFLLITLSACHDPEMQPDDSLPRYEQGFYIINEGAFMHANASLSYVGKNAVLTKEIYKKANGQALGDIVQDVRLHDGKAFIVVNASNKIVVAGAQTLQHIQNITSEYIKNPRYIRFFGAKAYVSNWGIGADASDDTVLVLDSNSYEVIKRIPVGFVPNFMRIKGHKLYVALQGWYPDINNQVAVIDMETDSLITNITVGDYPGFMELVGNSLYVMCSGGAKTDAAHLAVIDTQTDSSIKMWSLPEGALPYLAQKDGVLYYASGHAIFRWNTQDEVLPENPVIEINDAYIYGMKIVDNALYINAYKDYTGWSDLYVYNLTDNDLTYKIADTGLFSNAILFN